MPRERIKPNPKDSRFVRRNRQGRFDEVTEVGASLRRDRRTKAKRTVKPGEGDRGDQRRRGQGSSSGRSRATGQSRSTTAGSGRRQTGASKSRSRTQGSSRKTTPRKSGARRRRERRIDWRDTKKSQLPPW
jgi:hypothetical protein